jgi:hypothetical protein
LGTENEVDLGPSERVVNFLGENRGADFCDACIAENCEIEMVSEVDSIVSTLELFPEYLRMTGTCHRCGLADLLVTHAV